MIGTEGIIKAKRDKINFWQIKKCNLKYGPVFLDFPKILASFESHFLINLLNCSRLQRSGNSI